MEQYRRKDFSQASARAVPRVELVLTKIKWGRPESYNYLLFSDYNDSFWTVDTATDAGTVSMGVHLDKNRCRVNLDNTVTELGEQTWTGTGTFRSTTSTDLSGWTTLWFGFEFGPYQLSTTQKFTVEMGLCHSDGSSKQLVKSWGLTGGKRLVCSFPVASITTTPISACYFYITVTPAPTTGSWYISDLQLEKDTHLPYFVSAAGAAQLNTAPQQMRGIYVCHQDEWELVQETWEGIWPPREGQDQSSYVIEPGDV